MATPWPASVPLRKVPGGFAAETHRAHVMQKLRLSSRAELVSYALANGLVICLIAAVLVGIAAVIGMILMLRKMGLTEKAFDSLKSAPRAVTAPNIFKPFTDQLIFMSIESAEMTKHAINAFLALSVIPALKITDQGLVDVERFSLVPFDV